MLKQKLMETLELISETTQLFYQNKPEEGYQQLQSLLTVIGIRINEIDEYKKADNEIGIDETALVDVLNQALATLENNDTLLFSDIFEYDLKELLNKIIEVL